MIKYKSAQRERARGNRSLKTEQNEETNDKKDVKKNELKKELT